MEHNEESEFDKEDEHEHTEDCGHTEEQHARMNRVQKNLQKFMAENAMDMMDEKTFQKIEKRVRGHFHDAGATFTLTSLKLYLEGFQFGMMSQLNVPNATGSMLAAITKMVADKTPPKVEIDITKSKPMPKKKNEEE